MKPSAQLAFDRSMRRIDADGHLHVEMTNISKANVCPYYGREIPNAEALGLDPNKTYMLYRDPVELAAAAESFANKPLLMHHVPVTAELPERDLWVGTVGGPVSFKAPYLQAPLAVWTAEGIRLIDSREQEELSCAYRYRADMTPGVSPDGVAYHGVMRDIMGNHVALVAQGRAGPDVVVADASPPEFSMNPRFAKLVAAIAGLFATAPKQEQLVALDAALGAMDAEPDEDQAAMDAMTDEDKKSACDAYCAAAGKAADALTDEDKQDAYKRAAKDKRAKDQVAGNASAPAGPVGGAPKPAMDAAAVQLAVDAAVATAREGYTLETEAQLRTNVARAEVHSLYAARAAVADKVGAVALDSAELVYRFALDHLKVDHKNVEASALPALYAGVSAPAATAPALAQDAAAQFDIATILGISHIRKG